MTPLDVALALASIVSLVAGALVARRRGILASAPLLAGALAATGWLAHQMDVSRAPLVLLVLANLALVAALAARIVRPEAR